MEKLSYEDLENRIRWADQALGDLLIYCKEKGINPMKKEEGFNPMTDYDNLNECVKSLLKIVDLEDRELEALRGFNNAHPKGSEYNGSTMLDNGIFEDKSK